MSNIKETRQYVFTVEGETEQWYLYWLRDCINNTAKSKYRVSIIAKVQQNPTKYAKMVNPIAIPCATHLCDYESNDEVHIIKFQNILGQLKEANSFRGRSFRYALGYSNFTFELWIALHTQNCNGILTNRTQYLEYINRGFGEKFESLDQYKHQDNFKRCLSKLTLDNVRQAISRSKKIMQCNAENGITQMEYKGFHYYPDNPALTIWESVEKILKDCKIS